MLSVYLICFYSFLINAVLSREYHPKYHHAKYRNHIPYDSRILPEDTEVDVALYKNHVQKVYFVLEGGYRPISVTVTPCSSEIVLEWKISHSGQNHSPVSSYHSAAWSNHLRSHSTAPSATYVGVDRRSYTNPRAPPGMYTLEMTADDDTRARVLVTTRAISQMPYHPPLPPEPGVHIVKVKRNRILISWKASLSTRPLQYCVTSNHRSNYNSLCSAESDMLSAHSLLTYIPRNHHPHHNRPSMSRNQVSSRTSPGGHRLETVLTCVGGKTWHMFKGLQKGKTYFFDVFVLDTETNASSAYVGVSATLRGSLTPQSRLQDDTLVSFSLNEGNGYEVNKKYHLAKMSGPLLLFIQSCTGPSPVNLHISQTSPPKHEILSATIMDVKTIDISRQMAAPTINSTLLNLNIRSTSSYPRKVRVWMSSKRHALPFPDLPQDKGVRVFDTLTTCNSITIGWKTSPEERVKYCIYQQAADEELMEQTLSEPQNFCEPSTDGSTKRVNVLCRRYHRFSKRRFNNLIMQRVKGLKSGTTYLFEVQVTKVKGKMLPYEQVWATTNEICTHSRANR